MLTTAHALLRGLSPTCPLVQRIITASHLIDSLFWCLVESAYMTMEEARQYLLNELAIEDGRVSCVVLNL